MTQEWKVVLFATKTVVTSVDFVGSTTTTATLLTIDDSSGVVGTYSNLNDAANAQAASVQPAAIIYQQSA